jgi:hypothetical protein
VRVLNLVRFEHRVDIMAGLQRFRSWTRVYSFSYSKAVECSCCPPAGTRLAIMHRHLERDNRGGSVPDVPDS